MDFAFEQEKLNIPLDVKTYTVSVQKSGFQATPAEMTAAVQRGEQSRVMFRLKALPQNGSLALTGVVMEGAAVTSAAPDLRIREKRRA